MGRNCFCYRPVPEKIKFLVGGNLAELYDMEPELEPDIVVQSLSNNHPQVWLVKAGTGMAFETPCERRIATFLPF